MTSLIIRVVSLEHWRDGNGARGAEERLQDVETQLRENERRYQSDAVVIEKSIAAATEKLWDRLLVYFKNREKAWIEYLKAYAPYVASAASIIYGILT